MDSMTDDRLEDAVRDERPIPDQGEALRIAEALLFASVEPFTIEDLSGRLPEGVDVAAILEELSAQYAGRGVNLVRVAGGWAFRTASDLSFVLSPRCGRAAKALPRRHGDARHHCLSSAGDARGNRGNSRRRHVQGHARSPPGDRLGAPSGAPESAPGRPVTYGTTPDFLDHFGLDAIDDLPGLEELKGAGFLEGRVPLRSFRAGSLRRQMPCATDEDPLDQDDLFEPIVLARRRRMTESVRPPGEGPVPSAALGPARHGRRINSRAADLRGRRQDIRRHRCARPRLARRSSRANSSACSGHSGCGKTTLLRIAAGVETPSSGRVLIDGQRGQRTVTASSSRKTVASA